MKKLFVLVGILLVGNQLFGKTKEIEFENPSPPVGDDLFSLSYLGLSELPRGIRNNNPGNLKISNAAWQDKIDPGINTDGTFEQFNTYIYGVRAMTKLLINYIDDGYDTLDKIINRYAPSSENNSQAYINAVANQSTFNATQILVADFFTMQQLVIHMSFHENGREAVTMDLFSAAWDLI